MQYYLMTDYYFMMLNQMVSFYNSFMSEGLIVALVIMVIGVIFAIEFSKVTKKVFQRINIDKTLESMGLKSFLRKAGIKISVTDLFGWVVKWFVILFALMMAVDSLGLPQASDFLKGVLNYVPNLIGGLALLTIGLIVSQMVYEALIGTAKATGIRIYNLVALIIKWIIIIISFLAFLEQIGIETTIIKIFAGGFSLTIALAIGIAFGLGGKDHAKDLIQEIKNEIVKHK